MDTSNPANTMKAAWIAKSGGPEGLEIRTVPTPRPVADQVLVRVRASALNRADLLQRQGKYPAPAGFPQEIPGIEFAGEIAEADRQAAPIFECEGAGFAGAIDAVHRAEAIE